MVGPAFRVGQVGGVVGQSDAMRAKRVKHLGLFLSRLTAGAADVQEVIILATKLVSGDCRADHGQAGCIHHGDNDPGHGTGGRTDHHLRAQFDQLLRRDARLFGVLPIVTDDEFDRSAANAATGILLFDGEDDAVAHTQAKIGAGVGKISDETYADRL